MNFDYIKLIKKKEKKRKMLKILMARFEMTQNCFYLIFTVIFFSELRIITFLGVKFFKLAAKIP